MPLLTDLTIGSQPGSQQGISETKLQGIGETKLQGIGETKLQGNVIAVDCIADLKSVRGLQVSCSGEDSLRN